MKSTIIPAQITTVEDKITGNLTLSQLLLLSTPVFGGSILYIIFPPSLRFSIYKVVLVLILMFVFALMAIRVKGRIMLNWAIILARYNIRPRYYVFDKNHAGLRNKDDNHIEKDAEDKQTKMKHSLISALPNISTADIARLEQLITDPRANLSFKPTKKGGISVTLTQVE